MTTISIETDQQLMEELRRQILELRQENAALHEAMSTSAPHDLWWWYSKCVRQRDALDILNRRVVSQRFVLRTLGELGRGLTREEYLAAREAVPDERLRERIEKIS